MARRASAAVSGVRLLVAACAVLAIATACGTKTLNADTAEAEIKQGLERQVRADVRAVDCPDGVKAKKGNHFTCQATGRDGTKATIVVDQTNDEGGIHYTAPLLHTGTVEDEIARDLGLQIGAHVTVKCPDLVVAKPGTRLTCATTSRGKEGVVDVTVEDTHGRIRWKLRQ
jgi:Domain of unknown function (DUF4333)